MFYNLDLETSRSVAQISYYIARYIHGDPSRCRVLRIHHMKFLAFYGKQLEYNGSQGANGAG